MHEAVETPNQGPLAELNSEDEEIYYEEDSSIVEEDESGDDLSKLNVDVNRDDFAGHDSELAITEENYLAAVEQAQHEGRVEKMVCETQCLRQELLEFYDKQIQQSSIANRKLISCLRAYIKQCDAILIEYDADVDWDAVALRRRSVMSNQKDASPDSQRYDNNDIMGCLNGLSLYDQSIVRDLMQRAAAIRRSQRQFFFNFQPTASP